MIIMGEIQVSQIAAVISCIYYTILSRGGLRGGGAKPEYQPMLQRV